MGGGGGDDADTGAAPAATIETEPGRQLGQRGVAFVVEGMAVTGQLDADPVAPEPIHQIGQRLFSSLRTAVGKCLADMTFAAPGQDMPVSTGSLGERVEVVAQDALFAAGRGCLESVAGAHRRT